MHRPGHPIRKANPGVLQSDDEVVRQFAVRTDELERVLEVLRGNVGAASCQHVLVVAPRGQGKTMLLARVAAELRTSDSLGRRLLPVRYMEESMEIFDLADFWLEGLFHLAREPALRDPELRRELRATHSSLAARPRGEELTEARARAAVLDAADRLGKQLVLMVENLQDLCGDVDDDFGWKLRQELQSRPEIMLLATATSRFAGLDDASQPFFELFRVVYLNSLGTKECRRLWQVVSGEHVRRREIKPLKILTGGSPRLLVFVADFARNRSVRLLMEQLVQLVDTHSEYFRTYLEGLAKTERRVYLATVDLWQPSTVGEIATRARLDVRTVSTLLGRLVKRGAVTYERNGGKRYYVAAERLYGFYYKLRRERDTVSVATNLIRFMAAFYSGPEWIRISSKIALEAARNASILKGIDRVITETPYGDDITSAEVLLGIKHARDVALKIVNKRARDSLEKACLAFDEGELDVAIKIIDTLYDSPNAIASHVSEEYRESMTTIREIAQRQLDDPIAYIEYCDSYVETHSSRDERDSPQVQSGIAGALIMKAIAQTKLAEFDAGIEACDEVMSRYGSSQELRVQVNVAKALLRKGAIMGRLGNHEMAIRTYDEVDLRYRSISAGQIQAQVAKALVSKAMTQGLQGSNEAELATFREVVSRYDGLDSPDIRLMVAEALLNKGFAEIRLGRVEDAMRTCDLLAPRCRSLFGDAEIAFEWRATGLCIQALLRRGEADAALQAFRTTYDAFRLAGDGTLRDVLELAFELIASGASARGLLEILTREPDRASALQPLVVALRKRVGDAYRAPVEVVEVADDIVNEFDAMADADRGTSADVPLA